VVELRVSHANINGLEEGGKDTGNHDEKQREDKARERFACKMLD
jgi:hypothetical protein